MLFFGWILKFVKKYRTRGGFNVRFQFHLGCPVV
jgi:hypothetical protein